MTICIAALADKGKGLVVCADQMITASIPMDYEFETDDVPKIIDLSPTTMVLTAGNALYAAAIIKNVKKLLLANPGKEYTVEEIAEIVRQQYANFRRQLVIGKFLEPRGLSLVEYYQMQQTLVMGVVSEIENALTGFNLGVELIVTGVNKQEDCHVFSVTHPGLSISHDALGYVCVGSGAPHAMYFLIGSKYNKNKNLKEVETVVLQAKKRSEVAPGVGNETTIFTLPKIKEAKTNKEKNGKGK